MLVLAVGLLVGSVVMIAAVPVFVSAPTPRVHVSATVFGLGGLAAVTVSGLTLYHGGSVATPIVETDALSFFGVTYLGFSAVFWGDLGVGTWPPRWLDD